MGRLSDVQANNPHRLAGQGDGVFEFCCHIPPATPASWALDPAINEAGDDDPDTPIWYMIRADYTYCYLSIGSVREYDGSPGQVFRDLSSIYYQDVDGTYYRQTLPWFPVSAKRLPCDSRPLGEARYWRHLICNHAGLVPNLTRDNVVDLDISAPASLYSSVMVIQTDDRNDNYPVNDRLDIDQRLVIPNPYEPDWTDPLAQPTHASR